MRSLLNLGGHMAARNFVESQTLTRGVVSLYGKATGTGGAATQTLTHGAGIASVVQAATGVITITLADKYATLLGCHVSVLDSAAAHWSFKVTSETVSSTKTIVGQLYSAATTVAPAAAYLPTTAKICFRIDLLNTSR